MPERAIEDPIELDQVEARRNQIAEQVGAIQAMIKGELDNFLPLYGKFLLGSDKKVVRDEKGRRKRVAITMDDIHEHMDKMQLETEEKLRQALIKKTQFAIEAQTKYFSRSKSEKRRSQSQETADFTRALIARFEALPLPNCGWEWQEKEPTFARDEKTLEEFCNITLEETPAKHSDKEADLIPSVDLLDTRNPSTWNAIVRKQGNLFKAYIEDILEKEAKSARIDANVVSRVTRSGKPEYTQEQVNLFKENAESTEQTAQQIKTLRSFSNILPYFQAKSGKPLTFHELLVPEPQK